MRLTRAQALATERVDAALASVAGPEAIAAMVGEALRGAVTWDGHRIFAVDQATGGVNRLLAASAGDAGKRQNWLRDAYQRDVAVTLGPFQHAERLDQGFRVLMIHERLDQCFGVSPVLRSTIDERAFYRGYHEHRERFHPDVNHLNAILVNFPVGGRWVATMQAYRIDSERSFGTSDLAFMRALAPRVGEAIDVALHRERLARGDRSLPANGASGVLVVHPRRGVILSTPAGEAWLAELSRLPADRETLLPSSVWAAMAGLSPARPRVVTSVPTGVGTVTIEATPGGDDGSVALIVSPVSADESVVVPADWGLTGAEERVASLVIQGQSNRSIGEQLSISGNTVEWHLRRIYEKAGVRNRGRLAIQALRGSGAAGGPPRAAAS